MTLVQARVSKAEHSDPNCEHVAQSSEPEASLVKKLMFERDIAQV